MNAGLFISEYWVHSHFRITSRQNCYVFTVKFYNAKPSTELAGHICNVVFVVNIFFFSFLFSVHVDFENDIEERFFVLTVLLYVLIGMILCVECVRVERCWVLRKKRIQNRKKDIGKKKRCIHKNSQDECMIIPLWRPINSDCVRHS